MTDQDRYHELGLEEPVWERFFSVFPLVLVGTREQDGGHDLAPKHLAMPVSWQNLFGFVCTPRHATYHNARRTGEFTVSYPTPSQLLATTLAASPRCEDGDKPALMALAVDPARAVDGVVVRDAQIQLECRLEKMVDDLGDNSLIIGRIVAARVSEDAVRAADRDDNELVNRAPLLAYLYPFRFSVIDHSGGFPVPEGFHR